MKKNNNQNEEILIENYKKVKYISTELSKITVNLRYNFSHEDLPDEVRNNLGVLNRDMKRFFQDACSYADIINTDGLYSDKIFVFEFENKDDADLARKYFESLNAEVFDVDEEFSPDVSFTIVTSTSVNDFMFLENNEFISPLKKLATSLSSPFKFLYEYINAPEKSVSTGFIYPDGNINFEFNLEMIKLNSLNDFPAFNKMIYHFADVYPNLEAYEKNTVVINEIT